jgi:hypothetical protein
MEVWHCGQTNSAGAGFAGLNDTPPIALLSALFADTVDLKGVAGRQVVVLAPDFLFQFSDLGRKEFDGRTTLGAHHVVMAPPVVLMLVARDTVMKRHFAGQPAARKQFERAVDSGKADARIFLLDQPMQFVGRKVLAGFQKRTQDGIALFRLLQPDTPEVPQEDPFSFADVLPRNRWLIVDSFLQHGVLREKSGNAQIPQIAFMILGEGRLRQLERAQTAPLPRNASAAISSSRVQCAILVEGKFFER